MVIGDENGQKVIDEKLLDEIETLLLTADLGIEVTDELIEHLKKRIVRDGLRTTAELSNIHS